MNYVDVNGYDLLTVGTSDEGECRGAGKEIEFEIAMRLREIR